ncbi:hypothetical protein [Limnohabitans sp. Jir61]|uniref:hypothetical protein n=1 Tax=Limnohabitans sp. Jir61 TaxID=1826168 RepID=UPI0011B216DC|nr:hypothetical protein [Limnohabitans sp. Jir61]
MSVTFTKNPMAIFSHSCYVHYFNVMDVPVALAHKAIKVLSKSSYNGCWSVQLMGDEVHTIDYETTDEWEARVEFAEQLALEISQVFKKLV